MHILFITDNFPPEVNAPATRTFEHARAWVEMGARVTVITCAPNFPHGRVYRGYSNRLRGVEYAAGIRVVRVWSYIAANRGFSRRLLDYASFGAAAFLAGLFEEADVIVATSPQFFTTPAGYLLSRCKQKPWVFELRDLWPDSIRTVGAMKKERVLDWLEKVELFLYRKADLVVAVTEAFRRNLAARGIREEKISVVTNGVDMKTFQGREEKDAALSKRLGLDGRFVVGYTGTHGMAHKLDFIVRAVKNLPDGSVHFLFIGDGAEKENVRELAGRLGVANATFLDPVPKEEVPSYLSVLDAMLVPLKRADTFKTVIPSKIFEAAAMEKPVLLGVDGQAREIVEGYGAGLFFEPENEEDFLAQVKRLRADRGLYEELQGGCRRLAMDFDRNRLARSMYDILEELVTGSPGRKSYH
jgi:hypothetical protein